MTFGGYGGQPGAPFGGQQFGGQPFGGPPADPFAGQGGGGWQAPPSYQTPPPQQPETNQLATLSVVFAFVFAPVGAVLGHVALSQIKRFHQKGRERAIVGLVVSYVVILTAVVSLVVWAALPSDTSAPAIATSSSAPSSRGTPSTGATTTAAAPKPAAPSAVPITGDNFADVLLNGGNLTGLLNQQFDATPRTQEVGALDAMPNGLADESAASPHECVGATTVAQRSVYQGASVQHFASKDWWTKGSGPVMRVEEAVVVLASPGDAQALFTTFTNQWKGCEGRTVTTLAGTASDGSYYVTTANGVQAADSVLSAVLSNDHSTGGWATASLHALGVKGNCIVDVEVSLHGVAPGDDPQSGRGSSATDVVKAMMARIA